MLTQATTRRAPPAESNSPQAGSAAPLPLRGAKRQFADTFLTTGNDIKAARAAGAPYGKERAFAARMLGDKTIVEYIRWHADSGSHGLRPSEDAIRSEIHALAHSDLSDALELTGDGQLKRLRLDRIDGRVVSQLHVKQTKDGTEVRIRTHPKSEALRTEAQMAGLLADEGKTPPRVTIIFAENAQVNQGER